MPDPGDSREMMFLHSHRLCHVCGAADHDASYHRIRLALDYQGVMLHGPGCFVPIGVTQERFEAARQSPLDEELVRRKLRYFEAEHPDIVRTLKIRRGRTECYALVRALFRGLRARTARDEPDPGAS